LEKEQFSGLPTKKKKLCEILKEETDVHHAVESTKNKTYT
jgi:hypothetical protein